MSDEQAATPTVSAVREHVEALRRENQLDTRGEALAELALRLAAWVDGGEPVMMTASWARELRNTLAELAAAGGADGDGDDDSWIAGLPSPVRDSEI